VYCANAGWLPTLPRSTAKIANTNRRHQGDRGLGEHADGDTSREQAHGDKRIVKIGAQSLTTPNQFTVSVKVWVPVFLRTSVTLTVKV